MSDTKDDSPAAPQAEPPEGTPAPETPRVRTAGGHLLPGEKQRLLAGLAAAAAAGQLRSVKHAASVFGCSRQTIRRALEQLGLIGGASNQHKDGGITVRVAPAKRMTKAQKREEGRRRKEAHKAVTAAAKQRSKAAAPAEPPAPADPDQPSDPGSDPPPDPGSDPPPPPSEPPPGKRRRNPASDGGKGKSKARLPGSPTLADLLAQQIKAGSGPASDDGKARVDPGAAVDLIGTWALPTDFDPLERLRKLASAPFVEFSLQFQALRELVRLSGSKGKVDWSAITVEQVPEEMRHRLAGMLLPWLDFAELPEVVRVAPAPCRAVYKLTGVLPQKVEDAEAVLERWKVLRQELRELAGEVRAPQAAASEPLELSLAAETAYTTPQWEDGAN